MIPERTELAWAYQPEDLFEAPYRHAGSEYDLLIEGGRAVATLNVPTDPVDGQLEERIASHVEAILRARQLLVHRRYNCKGPVVYQHAGGRKDVAIRVGGVSAVAFAGQVDLVHRDAGGNVLRDTKAERIAEHTALLDSVAPKLVASPLLCGLLTSYSGAVFDPDNELVHLYEIRDALKKHYGREQKACAALGISRSELSRLGVLANKKPLKQGRHRGKYAARRDATPAELQEARTIVRGWIVALARVM